MKTIIFDFGKVVAFFDYNLTISKLAPHTDMSPDDIFTTIYHGELEDNYESGRMTSDEFLEKIRRSCRLRCKTPVIREAWSNIFRPNEKVCAFVPKLAQRYRLLLGSNTNELHAEWFCSQFAEVFQNFHSLILSHEAGVRKPKREFFHRCLQAADCTPNECVFIDDLPANVDGAESCGIRGVVYSTDVDLPARLTELGISL